MTVLRRILHHHTLQSRSVLKQTGFVGTRIPQIGRSVAMDGWKDDDCYFFVFLFSSCCRWITSLTIRWRNTHRDYRCVCIIPSWSHMSRNSLTVSLRLWLSYYSPIHTKLSTAPPSVDFPSFFSSSSSSFSFYCWLWSLHVGKEKANENKKEK